MYKEQLLYQTDYGSPGDNLFWQRGGTSYTIFPDSDAMIAYYNAAMANRNYPVSEPGYTGMQKFKSTERRPPSMNDCDNLKVQAVNYPYTIFYNSYSKYSPIGDCWGSTYPRAYKPYERITPLARVLPTDFEYVDFDGARRRAWWSMQPRFQGNVSMLNFLYELKDFKDIMKVLGNANFRALKGKLLSLRNYHKNKTKKDLDLTLPAANIHLINQFAIKPTMSDLSSIFVQLGQIVRQAQQEFQRAGDDSQRSHYSETEVQQEELTRGAANYWPWMSGSYVDHRFTATMVYDYRYSMRSELDAMMTYWGLTGNFEALWNATPFTFLWDYFMKVSKAVHAMEIDRNVDVHCTQYSESILSQSTTGRYFLGNPILPNCNLEVVVNGAYYMNPSTPIFINGLRSSHYRRVLTDPNKGSALPRFAVPTWAQTANILALARCFLH
jgi:hypothetical protein